MSENQFDFDESIADNGDNQIIDVDPAALSISCWNGRMTVADDDDEQRALVHSIRVNGQLQPAIAVCLSDGRLELIAGTRRRAAALQLGISLRVHVREQLSPAAIFAAAQGENDGRKDISLWERSIIYAKALDEQLFATDQALAQALGIDKSTVSRTLSLARAPDDILRLFADKRQITARQWWAFTPLLNRPAERERILDRAGLLEAKAPMPAGAIFASLAQAAAAQPIPETLEVCNEHGRRIARIREGAQGDLTVSISSMRELHPDQRRDWLKAVTRELADYVVRTFPRSGRA